MIRRPFNIPQSSASKIEQRPRFLANPTRNLPQSSLTTPPQAPIERVWKKAPFELNFTQPEGGGCQLSCTTLPRCLQLLIQRQGLCANNLHSEGVVVKLPGAKRLMIESCRISDLEEIHLKFSYILVLGENSKIAQNSIHLAD